ncbi:hypothetical protein KKF60_00390 [Patescibacteria group bacterium]|nr:hypothetical protein [Patescibacteria group bacterium]MBU4458356.1 hypothetical protein [Patescibacteria group bacterium]MCG2695889.1 hypothetical protein [Candidatus Portnoybacteria bacterium]
MKNNKQFFGVFFSVLICVFVFGVIVYATTTIGDNISAGGTLSGTNFSTNATYYNTFVGTGIETTTTGSWNTFVGYQAGYQNDDGAADQNTAIGYDAFYLNNTGQRNTAAGTYALSNSVSGDYNVAIGSYAMELNTTGDYNVAVGDSALDWNETGSYNVAIGWSAMLGAWPASTANTAVGYRAGDGNNSTGYSSSNNSIFGYKSGFNVRTGSKNILVGYQAGDALTYGSNNIVIGYDIDTLSATADNYMNIGGLIFGDLSTASAKYLGILDSSPAYTLSVDGTASVSDTMYVKDIYFSGVASVSSSGIRLDDGVMITTGIASPSGDCGTSGSLFIDKVNAGLYMCGTDARWNVK